MSTLLALATASGCAMQQKKVEKELANPAAPVDCATAQRDLRVLQSEKTNVAQRIAEGVTSIYPAGKEVARNSMEHATPITFPEDEAFDIGQDTRTGVAMLEYRYDAPFPFTGRINKVTINLGPDQVTAEEREKMAPQSRERATRDAQR